MEIQGNDCTPKIKGAETLVLLIMKKS